MSKKETKNDLSVESESSSDSSGKSENELKADKIIINHIYGSAGVGLIPIPMVDMVALGSIQINMVRCLANLYNLEFKKDVVKSLIGSLMGSVIPVAAAGPIISWLKIVPIVGQISSVIAMPALGGAATYAVGKVFVQHFESGGTFLTFDPAKVREHFEEKFKEGQEFVSNLKNGS